MKFKILIISVLFVCSILPMLIYAQNKVVVIPLESYNNNGLDAESLRALCRGYDAIGKPPPAALNCPPKLVFVSSGNYTGNMGGTTGPSNICQAIADQSAITQGRKFKSWNCSTCRGPYNEFVKSQTPYVLVNGTKVAESYDHLIAYDLQHPINIDENGMEWFGTYGVWTGCEANGEPIGLGDYCGGAWGIYDETDYGEAGMMMMTDHRWTKAFGNLDCGMPLKIYCFEQ